MIRTNRGACHDVNAAMLMPAPGDVEGEIAAKRLCASCAIRVECLNVALHTQHLQGIWGGLTASERSRLPRDDTQYHLGRDA